MEKETFLTFQIGDELFAVNVKNVLEVLEQQRITRVPKAPDHILGIINFRGEILPVINTRKKFSLNENSDELLNFIIIYSIKKEDSEYLVAATADGVKDVITIDPSEIKPIPEIGIKYDSKYIGGAIKRDEEFTLLINPERVFLITDIELDTQDVEIL